MSDQVEAVVLNQQSPKQKRHFNWTRIGIFITTVALFIFVAVFGFAYYQLAQINMSIANRVNDQLKQTSTNRTDIANLQQTVTVLQASQQKSQELSAKQEQLINDWQAAQKGDMEKWYAAEAQYLVKLANDHLVYGHNVPMALSLLQRADQVLQNLQDDAFLEIRKSLATDIANLQTMTQPDITPLYLQLSVLNNQIDQLPVPATPLKESSTATMADDPQLSWWQKGWLQTLDLLKKIVIVQYNPTNKLPLVMPEQKVYLYLNLHAQLDGAMWGLLHHNNTIYQANLTRILAWIPQYFDQDSPVTKSVVNTLHDLQKIELQNQTQSLSTTLKLFEDYFAKKK